MRALCFCGAFGRLRGTESASHLQGTDWRRTGPLVFGLAGAPLGALQPGEEGGGGGREREVMVHGVLKLCLNNSEGNQELLAHSHGLN